MSAKRKAIGGILDRPDRRIVAALMVGLALAFVGSASLLTAGYMAIARYRTKEGQPPPRPPRVAVILLDYGSPHFPYPFTIQNVMHVVFFVGLGELFVRWRVGALETRLARGGYLPEDDETVLQLPDLAPLRKRVVGQFDEEHGFLPALMDLSILQFQSSRSVDQTVAVMNSSLELMQHRVDMRYNMIRYVAWVIPTMGFIGTVLGLGASLAEAGQSAELSVQTVASQLAVGFDCTMVALVESAFLVLLLHVIQEREEAALNRAGSYCLKNLINRLYVAP